MASPSAICGSCDLQGITTLADYWCSECHEALCSKCNKFHFRNHNIILIDYNKPRLSISDILQQYKEQASSLSKVHLLTKSNSSTSYRISDMDFNTTRVTHDHAYNIDLPSSELGQTSATETAEDDRTDTEQQEKFYLLSIQCDGLVVDCIVDRRIGGKYSHLCHDINTKTLLAKSNTAEFHMQKKKVNADLPGIAASNTDFEILYTFSKIHPRQSDELKLLKIAIKKRQDLVCRWLISHCSNSNVVLSIRPPKHDHEICRVISWTCTKMFYKQYSSSLTNCSVWPGTKCKCKQEENDTNMCFKKGRLVIVVESKASVYGLPPKFGSFRIQHITPEIRSKTSREASTIHKTKFDRDSFYLDKSIPGDIADKLFNKHRNLTLLCPSPYKSQGYYRNHNVSSSMCLQMFCRVKGIVPIGEDHFPSHVEGMETDVLEGCPTLAIDIRVGETVGTLINMGTLGGFCTYMGSICFLTCAHVMYDVTDLLVSHQEYSNRNKVVKSYVRTLNGPIECGRAIRRIFDHDNSQTTSIDAALVEINPHFSVNPNDYIRDSNGQRTFRCLGMTTQCLEENCLDHKTLVNQPYNVPAVAAGAVSKHDLQSIHGEDKDEIDVNFSNIGHAQAHVNCVNVQPLLLVANAHMQLPASQQGNRIFRMYNQMVINIPLQAGDSGTCIYITGTPAGSGCIGMAVAFDTLNGLAIVTPLKEILKRL